MRRAPKLGDERFLIEVINTSSVEAMARKQGWDGSDGLREFCEPEDAAVYWERKTLAAAEKAARDWLSHGTSFYGCTIIDRQVFEQPHDDRGDLVDVPAEWQTQESYEVAMDGETIRIDR